MNEFELILRFFDRAPPRDAELGIGDDAALLPTDGMTLAVTTDMLVEGRHFFVGTDAASVGFKSLAVNLSDLAAMGARPRAFTLAIALPAPDESWLEGFARGLFEAADTFGCELIGGDTTRGPLTISITALGEVPSGAALRRDRAEPGDDVWVSGGLGAAAAVVAARSARQPTESRSQSLVHADFSASWPDAMVQRLDRPTPRLALGIELRHLARAAIDISDGLLADLAHITERARVAIQVRADWVPVDPQLTLLMSPAQALPYALNGGDDYELAFCCAPENRLAIAALGDRLSLPLTRIGQVRAGQGIEVIDAAGHILTQQSQGFDHFRAR